jgi:CRP/FNR family cyclic AMP-dependent transcriptional regulator
MQLTPPSATNGLLTWERDHVKSRSALAESTTQGIPQMRVPSNHGMLTHGPFADRLASLCLGVKSIKRDELICSQGEKLACLYLVKQGEVLLTRLSPDGREAVLAVLGPGEFFGETALLNGMTATFNAYSLQQTTLLMLSHQRFRLLLDNPSTCRLLLEALAHRCDDAWSQIEAMGCTRAEDKVRAVLSWLTRRIGVKTSDGVRIALNQSQLAQMIGSTRETLNRQLSALRKIGILVVKGPKRREVLYVLKPEALGAQ